MIWIALFGVVIGFLHGYGCGFVSGVEYKREEKRSNAVHNDEPPSSELDHMGIW